MEPHRRGGRACDDPPEREQALVDLARLPRATVSRAAPRHVLAAGQVDQVELPNFNQLLALVSELLDVDRDGEDAA